MVRGVLIYVLTHSWLVGPAGALFLHRSLLPVQVIRQCEVQYRAVQLKAKISVTTEVIKGGVCCKHSRHNV